MDVPWCRTHVAACCMVRGVVWCGVVWCHVSSFGRVYVLSMCMWHLHAPVCGARSMRWDVGTLRCGMLVRW